MHLIGLHASSLGHVRYIFSGTLGRVAGLEGTRYCVERDRIDGFAMTVDSDQTGQLSAWSWSSVVDLVGFKFMIQRYIILFQPSMLA